MNKIIFLHTINHFIQFKTLKADLFSDPQIEIFAEDMDLRLLLEKENIKYNIPEDYIYEDEIEKIRETVFNISYNWHNDLFKFKNYSLGTLNSWNYIYYFSRIIRNLKRIINIIESKNPIEFISFKDDEYTIKEFNRALEYISKIKNIKVTILTLERPDSSRLNLKNSLKSLIFFVNSLPSYTPIKFLLKPILRLLYRIQNRTITKHILIEGYHLNLGLVKEVSKEKNFQVLLLNYAHGTINLVLKNFKNTLLGKKEGFHIFFENYKTKNIKNQADVFIEGNLKRWNNLISKAKFQNTFKYEDISFWPLVRDYILEQLFINFKKLIQNILTNIKLFKKEQIDLFTVNADTTEFQKTMTMVATQLNIHSLVIQHGATQYFYDMGFLPLTAEKIAVWGETSQKNLNDNGLPLNKIVITGAPRFDKYIQKNQNIKLKEKIKNRVFKDLGISKNKKLILYTPGHLIVFRRIEGIHLNQSEFLKIFRLVLKTVKDFPETHLIIKLHYAKPSNQHIPEALIKDLAVPNVSIVLNYNIKDLLSTCDCLITGWSTTGIEGLIFNKPLIILDIRNKRFPIPFMEENAAFGVSTVEDFKSKLQICFNNPMVLNEGRQIFLKNYIYKLDGLSRQRLIDLIKNMISKNNL